MSQIPSTANQTPTTQTSPYLKYTKQWVIEWSDFEKLSTKELDTYFYTSYKNVVFYWQAEISVDKETKDGKFDFYLSYEDGPLAQFDGMKYRINILNSDKIIKFYNCTKYKAERMDGWGSSNVADRDLKAFQQKYDLVDSKNFTLQITLQIPLSAFTDGQNFVRDLANQKVGTISSTCDESEKSYFSKLFQDIDSSEKFIFSDCKLKSRDDQIFYGHRLVIVSQSESLAAILRQPENGPKDEIPFPSLSGECLKALLEYLYTNRVQLTGLSTKSLIEIGEAAKQYGLSELKKLSASVLWDRTVEKPEDCFDIVQLTDGQAEMKYVKHRAFDVLASNYEKLGLASDDLSIQFGGGNKGKILEIEFKLFCIRRLTPEFCV